MNDALRLRGSFEVECRGPGGALLWRERVQNGITTGGLTDLLSAGFAAGTQRAAWYFGLLEASTFSSLSASDTMSSHAGWTENQDYSGSRPAWSPTAAGGVALGSGASAFSFTANVSIRGIFLSSSSSKGGSTGILWSTALFGSTRTVVSGSTLSVVYTLRASGGAG